MTERQEIPPPPEAGLKIKRQRRRIYQEAAPEEQVIPQPTAPMDTPEAQPAPQAPPARPAAPGAAPELEAQARRIIQRYLAWSMGAGLVPLPLLDALALGGLQVLLIRDLARLYGLDFSAQRARALLAALLGGLGAASLGGGLWASWLKALPVVGQSLGAAAMPAVAGVSTHAVGMLFLRHFQSGGTLLDFSPARQADRFRQDLRDGLAQAAAPDHQPR